MILQLVRNGLKFRAMRMSGKPMKPQALSLEITHRCIARCMMCNIWKIPASVPDLPVEKWLEVLSSGLFTTLVELDITGGEPFLRKDLVNLTAGVCDLKKGGLGKLRSISVTTNGLLTERIAARVPEMLKMLQDSGTDLVVVVAMDAVGKLHDRIRGVDGAWEKAHATIQNLKNMQDVFANLVVGLKTTVLPLNVDELPGITRYADQHGLFTIISPCIVTEGRYLNPEKEESLRFEPAHIEKLLHFFDRQGHGWQIHSRGLARYYKTGKMKKPCSCGFNYLFIRSTGAVHLCPLVGNSVGNVQESSVERIYFSEKADHARRRIGKEPQCGSCTEPGLERYSLALEGWTYLALRLRMGRPRFLRMHHHLGMDKYIEH